MNCGCVGASFGMWWSRNIYDHVCEHLISSRFLITTTEEPNYYWRCDICHFKNDCELFATERAYIEHLCEQHVRRNVRCIKCGHKLHVIRNSKNIDQYVHICRLKSRNAHYPFLWYDVKHWNRIKDVPKPYLPDQSFATRLAAAMSSNVLDDFYRYFVMPDKSIKMKKTELVLYQFYTTGEQPDDFTVVWPHELMRHCSYFLTESTNRDEELFKCCVCDYVCAHGPNDDIIHFAEHIRKVVRCQICAKLCEPVNNGRFTSYHHDCTPRTPDPIFRQIWSDDFFVLEDEPEIILEEI